MSRLLENHVVINYFKEISKIPRDSGSEKAISDMLAAFARQRGCSVVQDDIYNIIITKPATKGFEHRRSIAIQGHLDMVCEKSSDSNHDFRIDPIELIIKEDFIYGNKTSIGADNGIAIAYAMAIIDSPDIKHPMIEFVFTVQEETTMMGAEELDYSKMKSRTLINLDSEEEGVLCVSCAGGMCGTHSIDLEWSYYSQKKESLVLAIKGLRGGHSGDEIIHHRANAIKLLGRALYSLRNGGLRFNLVDINGGLQDNAIPREASATILVEQSDVLKAQNIIDKVHLDLAKEYEESDPDLLMEIRYNAYHNKPQRYLSNRTLENIINAIMLIPNGVLRKEVFDKDLPRTSNNLGCLRMDEEKLVLYSLARSSVKSEIDNVMDQLSVIGKLIDCDFRAHGFFPNWTYKPVSQLREHFKDVYMDIYNRDLIVEAVHGGLECGFFASHLNDVDIVSYGPNIYDVHTSNEHVSISSIIRTWEYLINILGKVNN